MEEVRPAALSAARKLEPACWTPPSEGKIKPVESLRCRRAIEMADWTRVDSMEEFLVQPTILQLCRSMKPVRLSQSSAVSM